MTKPFKAPRKVTLCEEDISNSDVQAITETENARDQEARQDKDVFVNPYPKGIKLMSYREALECSKHGEVLRWSTDSEGEEIKATEPDKKQSFSCQHKFHITKVVGHGTVGYCFDSDPELGGTGYLIGLHRCQSFKVMQRKVNEQTVDAATGKRKQKGNPLKYNRGDLVLTDCNVTGSNYGTASKPKFPLIELWTTVLLPELDALVKPGGPC